MTNKVTSGGGRPNQYRCKDGLRVPGVTTIIGRFKDSGGLLHWCWQQGRDGLDYRQTTQRAADAGTVCHAMIEAFILGNTFDIKVAYPDVETDILGKASMGFEAFLAWSRMTNLRVLATEIPLVSEQYRYGGTIDAVGYVENAFCLIDWKSSARIYADYLLQLAAYRHLLEECRPVVLDVPKDDEPRDEIREQARMTDDVKGAHLLRVGKDFGDFHHHWWPAPVLDIAWQAFVLERQLYDLDRPLKAAAGC